MNRVGDQRISGPGGWLRLPTAGWARAAMASVAAVTVVLLGVDPAAAGPVTAQVIRTAAATIDTAEARKTNLEEVEGGLGIGDPLAATPMPTPTPTVPAAVQAEAVAAQLPQATTETVTLGSPLVEAMAAPTSDVEASDARATDAAAEGLVQVEAIPGEATPAQVVVATEPTATGVRLSVTSPGTGTVLGSESQSSLAEPSPSDMQGSSDDAGAGAEVRVSVDYSQFAGAFGGDWGERLRLVWVPECSRTTPQEPDCRPVPVADSVNDAVAQTVTGTVSVQTDGTTSSMESADAESGISESSLAAASVEAAGAFELMAGSSGPSGSWGASPLSPSGTWTAGGPTGGFSWSYPIEVPPAPAGPVPQLALSYSSAGVDARTPGSNPQASWVGEGWDLPTGFVERSYVPCAQDTKPMGTNVANNANLISGDLCWGRDNLQVVFAGRSMVMVKKSDGTWVPKDDDGTKVERRTDTTNGVAGNEYWVVTTTDGTRYTFGRTTPGAWTVPVYGNHLGEPGYQAQFKDSDTEQAWRWMLEQVEDVSGNTMRYSYVEEENYYAAFGATDGIRKYTRGGYPQFVEYGAVGSGQAPYRVSFATSERCMAAGSNTCTGTSTWFDTPMDQVCGSGSCANETPTFFTTIRLTSIRSEARSGGTWAPVSTWTLGQDLRNPDGDTVTRGYVLWLRQIDRTGNGGTAGTGDDVKVPPVWFEPVVKNTRVVAGAPGRPEVNRFRVGTVHTDAGADITIAYGTPGACSPGSLPGDASQSAAQQANTTSCFPVRWFDVGTEVFEWFYTYAVTRVTAVGAPLDGANTLVTGSLNQVTTYDYSGGVHWAKPSGPMIDPDDVTYSDLRGFKQVTTTTGEGADAQKVTETFLRGSGQSITAGPEGRTSTVTDSDEYRGRTLSSIVYDGTTKVSETVEVPGPVLTTATGETLPGGGAWNATRILRTDTYQYTYAGDGTYAAGTGTRVWPNQYGRTERVHTMGDLATTADDQCTSIGYDRRTELTGRNIMGAVTSTRTVTIGCGPGTDTTVGSMPTTTDPAKVLEDTATTVDLAGRPTRTEKLNPETGSGRVLAATVGYDPRGRTASMTDVLGRTTTTTHTQNGDGQLVQTVTTGPDPDGAGSAKPSSTTVTLNPLTGSMLSEADQNGRATTGTYDGLGRLVSVRMPQHKNAPYPTATYEYVNVGNGLNQVITRTLDTDGTGQVVSSELYDGLLRLFQTQATSADAGLRGDRPAADRGRVITHTFFDSAGRAYKSYGEWWASGQAGSGPVVPVIPKSLTTTMYDGAGRPVAESLWNGSESNPDHLVSQTVFDHDGLTTLVIPPTGTPPYATTKDATGQTVSLRRYLRGATDTATDPKIDARDDVDALVAAVKALSSQATTYAYTPSGSLSSILDTAGNQWKYTYDYGGRQLRAEDPDAGVTTTSYDAAGQVTRTLDGVANAELAKPAEQQNAGKIAAHTQVMEYDQAGRQVATKDGTGFTRTRLTYDTVSDPTRTGGTFVGLPATSSRFVPDGTTNGVEYRSTITGYDEGYKPLGTTVALPTGVTELGALAGRSFTTTQAYTSDGQVASLTLPEVTSGAGASTVLGKETVTTRYDKAGLPRSMSGGFGWGTYVASARYEYDGKTRALDLGTTFGAVVSYGYDQATGRLTGIGLDRERVSGRDLNLTYRYDKAGNVTSLSDRPTTSALGSPAKWDTQCFQYDNKQRLVQAWTRYNDPDAATCATAPTSTAQVGGAAPYWNQYSYDSSDNRTKLVQRTTAGAVATTTYAMGGGLASASAAGPHAVVSAVTSTDPDGSGSQAATTTATRTYSYDQAGQQVSRTVTGSSVTASNVVLGWDGEGELTTVETSGGGAAGEGTVEEGEAKMLYDASGERLTRTDSAGTTVYLPGGQEVHVSASGTTVSATRYYSFAGTLVGVRDKPGLGGVTSMVCDQHGTPVAAVPNTTWTATSVVRLYTDPFGAARGTAGTEAQEQAPGNRQFLGKTRDTATGLTLLGARYYDEILGRFLSPDPQLDPTNVAQLSAYVYAGNNPVTWEDPTGLSWWSNAWNSSKKWVSQNRGAIAGFAAGLVVGAVLGAGVTAACGALGFVSAGVGGVACAVVGYALVGAVAGAAESLVSSAVSGKKPTWRSVGTGALVGAAFGLLGPAGKLAGKVGTALTSRIRPRPAGSPKISASTRPAARSQQQTRPEPEGAPSCRRPGMSFAGSTLVLLADGTTKRIDQIAPGDKVASRDEHDPEGKKAAGTNQAKTGASTAGGTAQADNGSDDGKSVEAVWVHDDVLLEIHIDGRPLTTTEDHPFWSVTDQQWERADHLAQGEHVLTGDGTYGVVTTPIDPTTAYVGRAYNLTVEDWHTYHVLTDGDRGPPLTGGVGTSGDVAAVGGTVDADATSTLVHNCPTGDGSSNIQPGNNPAAARGTEIHHSTEWKEHLSSLGYSGEKALPSGVKPDGFTPDGLPVELKPATQSGIRRGTRELRAYMREMGVDYGELWTYKEGADGLMFSLTAIPKSPFRWLKW